VRALCVPQPQLEARHPATLRVEARPARPARERTRHRVALDTARNHDRDAGGGGHLGGDHLRAHPSGAERRCGDADVVALQLLQRVHVLNHARAGIALGVTAVQAAHIGEQHEPIGADQDRHLGGEEVVVAERDLIGRRRVVFVDHRHHAPAQQRLERVASVQVVGARRDVEEGEQHLCRLHMARLEQLVIGVVELALADRRRCLELLDRAGTNRQLHLPDSARDRPRCDDHDVVARVVAGGELVAEGLEDVGAQLAGIIGDDVRPDLGHDGGHLREEATRRGRQPASNLRPRASGAAGAAVGGPASRARRSLGPCRPRSRSS
jgi:hypothetical protein